VSPGPVCPTTTGSNTGITIGIGVDVVPDVSVGVVSAGVVPAGVVPAGVVPAGVVPVGGGGGGAAAAAAAVAGGVAVVAVAAGGGGGGGGGARAVIAPLDLNPVTQQFAARAYAAAFTPARL
jgi:hypothetical protein